MPGAAAASAYELIAKLETNWQRAQADAREKNVMRGLLVGSAAVWTAAAAQAVHLPGAAAHGLIAGLGSFHQSLTLPRASLFAANAVMAVFLGSASIRRTTA